MRQDYADQKEVIAAFDFDGTITYRDSLLPFLLFSKGVLKTFFLLSLKIPLFTSFLCGKASRQRVKEEILTAFFKGEREEKIKIAAKAFAETSLKKQLKPVAMRRIKWHQKQGHQCVLVSASVEIYLKPWGKKNGFVKVLGSKLELDKKGCATGKLKGLNCRGEEKVRRLKEWLGDLSRYRIYAYGDSKGDKEMLEIADYSYYRDIPEPAEYIG